MKIGILTHPLKTNYGGILQNYALQTSLINLGHDVKTIHIGQKIRTLDRIKSIAKYPIKKLLKNSRLKAPLNSNQIQHIEQYTQSFIQKNINTTKPLAWVNHKLHNEYNFDAYIVGSDQVWRPNYVHKIEDMFLEFAQAEDVCRLAYAASFGIDKWTFTESEKKKCKALIKKFDAVSVREKTGIGLCKKHFNTDAVHLTDPVALLEMSDYINLIPEGLRNVRKNKQITCYILDNHTQKQAIIESASKALDCNIERINNPLSKDESVSYKDRIVPPVENWLAGFYHADYVITDSFHGTLFSIIFNKPFITIGNSSRGNTRMESLLRDFNLEEQLMVDSQTNPDNYKQLFDIDFKHANNILREKRVEAIHFLTKHLKKGHD